MTNPLPDLRRHPYFRDLSLDALEILSEQLHLKRFRAGQLLLHEGASSAGLWMVCDGLVKIFKLSTDGDEHIVHFVVPGGSFNEVALFAPFTNPANAAAIESGCAYIIDLPLWQSTLSEYPALLNQIVAHLTQQNRSLLRQIEGLAMLPVTARLARFLISQTQGVMWQITLSRVNIASHLGITPETVSRSLRELEQSGAISVTRHGITINNIETLRSITQHDITGTDHGS